MCVLLPFSLPVFFSCCREFRLRQTLKLPPPPHREPPTTTRKGGHFHTTATTLSYIHHRHTHGTLLAPLRGVCVFVCVCVWMMDLKRPPLSRNGSLGESAKQPQQAHTQTHTDTHTHTLRQSNKKTPSPPHGLLLAGAGSSKGMARGGSEDEVGPRPLLLLLLLTLLLLLLLRL